MGSLLLSEQYFTWGEKNLSLCLGGTSIDANNFRSWQTRLKRMKTAIAAIMEKP